MPTPTLTELYTSRDFEVSWTGAEVTRRYLSDGSDNENDVYAAAVSAAPVVFDGLVRQRIRATPLGGLKYTVEVSYAPIDQESAAGATPGSLSAPSDSTPLGPRGGGGGTGGGSLSFEVSAGTFHITQSRQTISSTAAPGFGPAGNFEKAIGVTKDRVEGCDIFGGKLEFTVPATRPEVKLPYIRTLKGLVGTTNNAAWWGFAKGEVLYLGASGQCVPDVAVPKWNVSHKFAVGENEVNVDVGNGIVVPAKGAWEYLWVDYAEKVIGGFVLQVPRWAFVEKVYRDGNFANLQIGV